jgi:hypothetical protein
MVSPMTTRPITTTLAMLALVGLLGACSGGDGGSEGASGEQAQGDGAGQEMFDWVDCMGGEGIDLPEPTRDANGDLVITGDGINIGGTGEQSFAEYSSDEIEAASEVCGYLDLTAPGVRSDETVQEEQEMVLEFSRCMREHGVEKFPDPDFSDDMSDGAYSPWDEEAFSEVESDPDFEAAEEACRDIMVPPGAAGEPGEGSDG